MQTVAKFEKVSYEQFKKDLEKTRNMDLIHQVSDEYGRIEDEKLRKLYDEIKLPRRATTGSAGYDFFSPFDMKLYYGMSKEIPTGIRCKMDPGWVLGILPRSGMGFRTGIRLANTMGVIDSDYYNSDNEGHIFVKLVNNYNLSLQHDEFPKDLSVIITINKGSAFTQGLFLPYGITVDDECSAIRNGGMGSTDK